MHVGASNSAMLAYLFCAVLLLPSGVPGTFRGTVVRGPDPRPGWIFVAGANQSLRRVEVSNATISYDESVPVAQRAKVPSKSLTPGADIRVTAEQDDQGEWRATEIEILHLSPRHTRALRSAAAPNLL